LSSVSYKKAGVGLGHRRRLLDWYGFPFSISLCSMYTAHIVLRIPSLVLIT
jgi:hypothetical protein